MRRELTEPERRLWRELRGSRLEGHKFRRQDVIGQRIVDFFCPAKGLVVEVDGDTHDAHRDARRDAAMDAQFGFRTVRVTNVEVMKNMEGVLQVILQALRSCEDRWARHHPPAPSSEEEGEQ